MWVSITLNTRQCFTAFAFPLISLTLDLRHMLHILDLHGLEVHVTHTLVCGPDCSIKLWCNIRALVHVSLCWNRLFQWKWQRRTNHAQIYEIPAVLCFTAWVEWLCPSLRSNIGTLLISASTIDWQGTFIPIQFFQINNQFKHFFKWDYLEEHLKKYILILSHGIIQQIV